ncbi:hypothetical protein HDU98_000816 [Podochytrium sp. JEL0797]|nr:hypothetical protein HDU98_000816 [Podochytrium sp. JEL0797]
MGNSTSTARRDIEEQRRQYQIQKAAKAAAAKVAIEKAQTVAATWRPEDAEGDRTYHAIENSAYLLPNDELERDRLELQGTVFAMAFGHFAISPAARAVIKTPNVKVLDIGCANGAWMDSLFAHEGGLNCEYHGVDISEDTHAWMPVSGAKFKKGSVLESLPYDDNEFDYVHMRMLFGAIPKTQWVHAIKEAIRVCQPGGIIELCEMDLPILSSGPATSRILTPVLAALASRGLDTVAGTHLRDYFTAAGEGNLTNFEIKTVSIPFGWNGQIGDLMSKVGEEVYRTMGGFMTKVLGIEQQEWFAIVDGAVQEWPQTKAFTNATAVWAQKARM